MRRSHGTKEKACALKVWYRTAKKAKDAAKKAEKRNDEPHRGPIRPYKCAHCGEYHIGHASSNPI